MYMENMDIGKYVYALEKQLAYYINLINDR